MKTFSQLGILLLGITFFSCDGIFQFNPNQIVLKESQRNLTGKNIEKIVKIPVKDTLRFIFMGDSQRWYDETTHFVESANEQRDIDFVLHGGDISDFGITKELKWINDIMKDLKYPYLTVIGNHDIVANGSDAYVRMFGPLDYTFNYGDYKFIFINTNSLEYGLDGSTPNIPWLKSQLADNPDGKQTIVIGHVPPFDADFDRNLEKEYAETLAADPNLKFTLYGHQHAFKEGEYYDDGVHYYQTTSMGDRGYLIITCWKDGQKVERVQF